MYDMKSKKTKLDYQFFFSLKQCDFHNYVIKNFPTSNPKSSTTGSSLGIPTQRLLL